MRKVKFVQDDIVLVNPDGFVNASALLDPSTAEDFPATGTLASDTSLESADLNSVIGFDSSAGGPPTGDEPANPSSEAGPLGAISFFA